MASTQSNAGARPLKSNVTSSSSVSVIAPRSSSSSGVSLTGAQVALQALLIGNTQHSSTSIPIEPLNHQHNEEADGVDGADDELLDNDVDDQLKPEEEKTEHDLEIERMMIEEERKKSEPRSLSLELIRQRCLTRQILESNDQQLIDSSLIGLTHLYLDGLSLCNLDGLELFTNITHLYAQRNRLDSLEPLQYIKSLRFLALMHNDITQLLHIKSLDNLIFLDLSFNQIDDFDTDELPPNLHVLNMTGNAVQNVEGYFEGVIAMLPWLTKFDGKEVTKQTRIDLGFEVSDSEGEEDDEGDETVEDAADNDDGVVISSSATQAEIVVDGAVSALHQQSEQMINRSKDRQQQQEQEHAQSKQNANNTSNSNSTPNDAQ